MKNTQIPKSVLSYPGKLSLSNQRGGIALPHVRASMMLDPHCAIRQDSAKWRHWAVTRLFHLGGAGETDSVSAVADFSPNRERREGHRW